MSLPSRSSRLASAIALAMLVQVPFATAQQAGQELVIFQDVPSVEELNAVLFGNAQDAAPAPIKTRAIRFHDQPAAQAPAPAPAPAESAGTVASTAPVAPAPAPPPSGTALGMNILFEFNSTHVLAESVPYLERLGEVLNLPENQSKVINIVGHTDASGSAPYNQQLSEQRALAVGQYLVSTWQIDPNRLGVEGRGESQPLAGTDPYDGVNRRVEFYAIE